MSPYTHAQGCPRCPATAQKQNPIEHETEVSVNSHKTQGMEKPVVWPRQRNVCNRCEKDSLDTEVYKPPCRFSLFK